MIAEKCEGLPLLILTVARILRGLDMTEEFWKMVADEKTTTFTDAYDENFEVLYSSYEYLPQHLKACFLYMGVFPERSEIPLPKLLNLWIAEDFLESPIFESKHGDCYIVLENSAMEYLKTLVSYSVVIICKYSSNFRIKSCRLHSVYWYMCAKEARKDKLFHVLKKYTDDFEGYMEGQRRMAVQNNILFGIEKVYNSMAATLTVRSLLCTGPGHEYPVPICLNLVFLKVLDAAAIRFYEFPTKVVELVRLKYLALTHHGKLPCSISKLQKLQCLIIRHHHNIRFVQDSDSSRLPKEMRDEIQDMHQVWSTRLLGDSTCLAKEIWEMICDIQQVWTTALVRNPTCLTKNIWMGIWKVCFDKQQYITYSYESWEMLSYMQELWSTKLTTDSASSPKEIWVEIWEKIWDMQEVWSIRLQRDSVGLVKEIWEEIWNMQEARGTKFLSDSTFLPKEIWKMQKLRHLRITGRNLPDPRHNNELPYLSTLYVNAQICTYSVFNSLRLKKLRITIELRPDVAEIVNCFKHIRLLYGLRSLKCVVVNPQLISQVVAPPHHLSNLPKYLTKLSLYGLGHSRESMSAIGSMLELEVLKLRCCAFQGAEWETKAKEFRRLKYMLLEDIDLVRWTSDASHV